MGTQGDLEVLIRICLESGPLVLSSDNRTPHLAVEGLSAALAEAADVLI
jgi:hypothetical protein